MLHCSAGKTRDTIANHSYMSVQLNSKPPLPQVTSAVCKHPTQRPMGEHRLKSFLYANTCKKFVHASPACNMNMNMSAFEWSQIASLKFHPHKVYVCVSSQCSVNRAAWPCTSTTQSHPGILKLWNRSQSFAISH